MVHLLEYYLSKQQFNISLITDMPFHLLQLLQLKLNKQIVPSYGSVQGKSFPQYIPTTIVALSFTNYLVKLLIPLILEQTYSSISSLSQDPTQYVLFVTLVIAAIGFSQLILIVYTMMLTVYRFNAKRQMSMRILKNNFRQYTSILQSDTIADNYDSFDMDLRIKISTKVSVYLHNYYQSYLSLIFQIMTIVVIFFYLLYKLSFSLFFGIAIAALVMYKTMKITNQIQKVKFDNIERRARRLKILEEFFNRITEFKMCWLDKWVYDKIHSLENAYQQGLREHKMLDCWCVALWQFTSVGISSIVITAYFLLGFNQKIDKESVFSPSTFIYLLGMLNFPLNALGWYIAGIKTARQAIEQLQKDVRVEVSEQKRSASIIEHQNCFTIPEKISLKIQSKAQDKKIYDQISLPIHEFPKNKIYSIKGPNTQKLMSKIIFLLQSSSKKGYVEQNAWLSASPLQTIKMQNNITELQPKQKHEIIQLMELFCCSDIPLNTTTKNYSGGQKLRISLVRAFYLGQVIVINSDLKSLDYEMQQKVKGNIRKLVNSAFDGLDKKYTVFIKQNQDISDCSISITQKQHRFDIHFSAFKQEKIKQESLKTKISTELQKYSEEITQTVKTTKQRQQKHKDRSLIQKFQEEDDKIQQKSIVSLSTFKLYYKSKKHITFIISILAVTTISNYYNYYINTYINLSSYDSSQVIFIAIITAVFAFGLFFRSYYFADANLDQSLRICHNLNSNIIMNQLQHYHSEPTINEDQQAANSKSRLICALTSDSQTISDQFPFSTNIFANNIVIILSSMIVILIEVPSVLIVMVFLVIYANRLNQQSHKKDQFLKISMKEKDVDIYRIMSQMEDGKKYIVIYNKFQIFSDILSQHQEELYSIDWLNQKFKSFINLKYKVVMLGFLAIAVALYSFMNVFTGSQDILASSENLTQNSKSSSGLALLIQYTTQLSSYLLFFTMSIWEIKGQAVSLERVRPFIDKNASVKARIQASQKMIEKAKNMDKATLKEDEVLIDIKDFTFAYEQNPKVKIFQNLNFSIRKGDKIKMKGRSGVGKTTLYKLLTSAYPNILSTIDDPFVVSFSAQHPLVLPDTHTIEQNLNPYNISYNKDQINSYLHKNELDPSQPISQLNYEQKIVVNNLRAFIYGKKGIILYDEPQLVIDDDPNLTYLIVTHHHNFKHNISLEASQGRFHKT